ncbi:MAG: nitrous oxide reductase accessory protein NosL [Zoogloea sp.]|nr:nitrous oxide reductase accessory protein NosL [Zoogloea sp.]MCA0188608.1 nitrous oxide reductase accessory protein NosL [Pseudomonadota bacterium]
MTRQLLAALLATTLIGLGMGSPLASDLSPREVQRNTRCPVCGMYPAMSPQWMAQVVFNDQSASSFDSPVDLFRFLNNMLAFDKRHKPADVGAVWVADYGTRAWTDARTAFYVTGSQARGPMNEPNLPAFATRAAAEAHARTQGGRVLGYPEITRELLRSLGNAHQH